MPRIWSAAVAVFVDVNAGALPVAVDEAPLWVEVVELEGGGDDAETRRG